MLDYLDTDRCRMRFLRDQLDDPDERDRRDCGRCDNCGGLALPDRGLRRGGRRGQDAAGTPGGRRRAAQDVADRAGQPRPRPQGPDRRAAPSRAARSPGSPTSATARRCASCSGRDRHDGPVPASLVHAVIEVLDDWRPEVDGIVVVESRDPPALTADLADGLSRYLRMPVVGRWAIADPAVAPGQGAMNSAQRVAAVGRRFRLEGRGPGGAGAAGRRPGRHRLDPHPGGPGAARGRGDGRPPPHPGGPRLRRGRRTAGVRGRPADPAVVGRCRRARTPRPGRLRAGRCRAGARRWPGR